MRELSLHILDLVENSIRAGGTIISVTIEEDHAKDTLKIVVEDNGAGFGVSPQEVLNPFYTTKKGKRVGLGLSLFQTTARLAGGNLEIGRSALGGVAVTAILGLSHIDRVPLGNLAATLSSVVCTNPMIDLWCRFHVGGVEQIIKVSDVAGEMKVGDCRGLAVARQFSEKVRSAIVSLKVRA